MKKTLIIITMLTGAAMADDVTIHGVTFTSPSDAALHNAYTQETAPESNLYLKGQNFYTNANSGTTYKGIYITAAEDTALKFNHQSDVTVDYLYIDPAFVINKNTELEKGAINWQTKDGVGSTVAGRKFNISSNAGTWVDVNASYTYINTSDMTGGTVYLNEYGSLASTLLSTNSIHATAIDGSDLLSLDSDLYTVDYSGEYALVTRQLMTGDYSNWTGSITIDGFSKLNAAPAWNDAAALTATDIGKYYITASNTGLSITYATSIPEPATATLSLLAVAGLAARRRRK